MLTKQPRCLILVFIVSLLWMSLLYAAAPQPAPEDQKQPAISLPEDVGTTIAQKAASVKTEIATRASSLFERTPIGWDWNTIEYLYKWYAGKDVSDEAAQFLFQSFRTMLSYATLLATIGIILNLLSLRRLCTQGNRKSHPAHVGNERLAHALVAVVGQRMGHLMAQHHGQSGFILQKQQNDSHQDASRSPIRNLVVTLFHDFQFSRRSNFF